MKREMFVFGAFVCVCVLLSSCKKEETSLLVGTWNWHNYFNPDYYAGQAKMTYTFTKDNFEIRWDDEVPGSHSDHFWVKGTYNYDESSKTLVMEPTSKNWDTWKTSAYTVQTLNKTTLVLISLKSGEINTFTRK